MIMIPKGGILIGPNLTPRKTDGLVLLYLGPAFRSQCFKFLSKGCVFASIMIYLLPITPKGPIWRFFHKGQKKKTKRKQGLEGKKFEWNSEASTANPTETLGWSPMFRVEITKSNVSQGGKARIPSPGTMRTPIFETIFHQSKI